MEVTVLGPGVGEGLLVQPGGGRQVSRDEPAPRLTEGGGTRTTGSAREARRPAGWAPCREMRPGRTAKAIGPPPSASRATEGHGGSGRIR